MFNTIKDYAAALFYVVSAFTAASLIILFGSIVLIPALIYVTYLVLKYRRELREKPELNHEAKYTTLDSDRTKSHEDRG